MVKLSSILICLIFIVSIQLLLRVAVANFCRLLQQDYQFGGCLTLLCFSYFLHPSSLYVSCTFLIIIPLLFLLYGLILSLSKQSKHYLIIFFNHICYMIQQYLYLYLQTWSVLQVSTHLAYTMLNDQFKQLQFFLGSQNLVFHSLKQEKKTLFEIPIALSHR